MSRADLASRLQRFGLILFCLSLPVSLPANNLAIGLIVVASLVEGNWFERLWRRETRWMIVPAAFFGLHVAGMVNTENISYGLGHLETKAALLLLPLTLGTTNLLTLEDIRVVFRWFLFSLIVVILACVGFATYVYGQTGAVDSYFYYALTGPLDIHPIYLALYLAVGVLAVLYFHHVGTPLFAPHLETALLLIFTIFIYMLTALVVMVVLPLLVAGFYYRFRLTPVPLRTRLILLSFGLTLLVTMAVLFPYTRKKIMGLTQLEYRLDAPDYAWGSLTIRLAKWECSWAVIREHYVLGVGTGDAQDALMESYRLKGFSEGARNNYNTHNQYLESWTMLGLAGLVLLVAAVWPFRGVWLWQSAMTLVAVSMLTENLLDRQKGVVFVAFLMAVLGGPLSRGMKSIKPL